MLILPSLNGALNGGQGNLIGVTYNVRWTPTWFNQSHKAANGASIDISLASAPLHLFEVTFSVLRDFPTQTYSQTTEEFRRIFGFYNAVGGSRGRWVFDNPYDDSVVGQRIAVGDGTTTTFTIVHSFADIGASSTYGVGDELLDPIGLLSFPTPTPNVYLNGVLQGSGYTFNTSVPGAQTITFSSAPGNLVVITMDFSFYYYCRFTDDSITFDNFANGYWEAQSVKFMSCRPGA